MQAIFIRRGPWAWIQSPVDDPPEGALTVNSLAELPAALAGLVRQGRLVSRFRHLTMFARNQSGS